MPPPLHLIHENEHVQAEGFPRKPLAPPTFWSPLRKLPVAQSQRRRRCPGDFCAFKYQASPRSTQKGSDAGECHRANLMEQRRQKWGSSECQSDQSAKKKCETEEDRSYRHCGRDQGFVKLSQRSILQTREEYERFKQCKEEAPPGWTTELLRFMERKQQTEFTKAAKIKNSKHIRRADSFDICEVCNHCYRIYLRLGQARAKVRRKRIRAERQRRAQRVARETEKRLLRSASEEIPREAKASSSLISEAAAFPYGKGAKMKHLSLLERAKVLQVEEAGRLSQPRKETEAKHLVSEQSEIEELLSSMSSQSNGGFFWGSPGKKSQNRRGSKILRATRRSLTRRTRQSSERKRALKRENKSHRKAQTWLQRLQKAENRIRDSIRNLGEERQKREIIEEGDPGATMAYRETIYVPHLQAAQTRGLSVSLGRPMKQLKATHNGKAKRIKRARNGPDTSLNVQKQCHTIDRFFHPWQRELEKEKREIRREQYETRQLMRKQQQSQSRKKDSRTKCTTTRIMRKSQKALKGNRLTEAPSSKSSTPDYQLAGHQAKSISPTKERCTPSILCGNRLARLRERVVLSSVSKDDVALCQDSSKASPSKIETKILREGKDALFVARDTLIRLTTRLRRQKVINEKVVIQAKAHPERGYVKGEEGLQVRLVAALDNAERHVHGFEDALKHFEKDSVQKAGKSGMKSAIEKFEMQVARSVGEVSKLAMDILEGRRRGAEGGNFQRKGAPNSESAFDRSLPTQVSNVCEIGRRRIQRMKDQKTCEGENQKCISYSESASKMDKNIRENESLIQLYNRETESLCLSIPLQSYGPNMASDFHDIIVDSSGEFGVGKSADGRRFIEDLEAEVSSDPAVRPLDQKVSVASSNGNGPSSLRAFVAQAQDALETKLSAEKKLRLLQLKRRKEATVNFVDASEAAQLQEQWQRADRDLKTLEKLGVHLSQEEDLSVPEAVRAQHSISLDLLTQKLDSQKRSRRKSLTRRLKSRDMEIPNSLGACAEMDASNNIRTAIVNTQDEIGVFHDGVNVTASEEILLQTAKGEGIGNVNVTSERSSQNNIVDYSSEERVAYQFGTFAGSICPHCGVLPPVRRCKDCPGESDSADAFAANVFCGACFIRRHKEADYRNHEWVSMNSKAQALHSAISKEKVMREEAKGNDDKGKIDVHTLSFKNGFDIKANPLQQFQEQCSKRREAIDQELQVLEQQFQRMPPLEHHNHYKMKKVDSNFEQAEEKAESDDEPISWGRN